MHTNITDTMTLCIINYNGCHHLREAFAAINKLPVTIGEILVIDDASTDDSLEYLKNIATVNVTALHENIGPGGARNIGMQKAKYDRILFQDNDIKLAEGVIDSLSKALDNDPEALIAAPRVIYNSQPDTIQYESADCHFLGLMSLRNANTPRFTESTLTKTSSLVTACFMIDRSRWGNEKLFDESLIFNLEDHDLGVRANLLGFNTLVVPEAEVLHGSGTEGLSYRPADTISRTRMYCLIRNRWWIIFRYFSLRTIMLLSPALFVYEIVQMLGLLFKGYQREWLCALYDTFKHRRELVKQRKYYQSIRQRADRKILRGGSLPFTVAIKSNVVVEIAIKIFEASIFAYWFCAKKLL